MADARGGREIVVERFAKSLKQARHLAGLSQETLGLLAGLHRTEIGKLEYAERVPRIDSVVKLATVLGITVDQLVAGVTWEQPQRLGERGRFVAAGKSSRPSSS